MECQVYRLNFYRRTIYDRQVFLALCSRLSLINDCNHRIYPKWAKFFFISRNQVWHPMITLNCMTKFDVECNVIGGGTTGIFSRLLRSQKPRFKCYKKIVRSLFLLLSLGQAGAIRLAISRALSSLSPDFPQKLLTGEVNYMLYLMLDRCILCALAVRKKFIKAGPLFRAWIHLSLKHGDPLTQTVAERYHFPSLACSRAKHCSPTAQWLKRFVWFTPNSANPLVNVKATITDWGYSLRNSNLPVRVVAGLLTRDSRFVERKKPGQKKARKKFAWFVFDLILTIFCFSILFLNVVQVTFNCYIVS